MSQKKVAIMQPYFFPYLGYFQLMSEVDIFVVYNDINYIERGWANRNNFLINKNAKLLTLPLKKASSSKLFNQIEVNIEDKQARKLINTIYQNYSKAPYFEDVFQLFNKSLELKEAQTIDQLCLKSFKLIKEYVGLNTNFIFSSDIDYNRDGSSVQKINEISNNLDASEILFPPGSRSLYNDKDFSNFKTYSIIPLKVEYYQNLKTFVPNLSFLDVLMFNSISSVKNLLSNFERRSLSNE